MGSISFCLKGKHGVVKAIAEMDECIQKHAYEKFTTMFPQGSALKSFQEFQTNHPYTSALEEVGGKWRRKAASGRRLFLLSQEPSQNARTHAKNHWIYLGLMSVGYRAKIAGEAEDLKCEA